MKANHFQSKHVALFLLNIMFLTYSNINLHLISQRECATLDYVSLLTYSLLTPWCRVLLEKLTGLQLLKKFPAFYGIRRFITAFTSFRHLSLSWASPIQSTCPQPTSCRSILILRIITTKH